MGKNYFKFIVLLTLLWSYNLSSQLVNCKKLVNWTDVVKQEFPNQDFNRLRTNSKLFQQIVFNLYSDEYFVPHFKKPYDEMSNSKRSFYWKQLRSCKSKKTYDGKLWKVSTLLDPLANGHSTYQKVRNKGAYSTHEMEKKVEEIRILKNEIKQLNKSLIAGTLSFEELERLENRLNTDFAVLFPSAIKQLKINIQNSKSKSALLALRSRINEFPNQTSNKLDINALAEFELNNRKLFKELDKNSLNEIINLLNLKRRPIFMNFLEKDLLSFTKSSFLKDIRFLKSFRDRNSKLLNVLEEGEKVALLNKIDLRLDELVRDELIQDEIKADAFVFNDIKSFRGIMAFCEEMESKYQPVFKMAIVQNWLDELRASKDLKVAWFKLESSANQLEAIGRGLLRGEHGFKIDKKLGLEFLKTAHTNGSTSAAGLIGSVYYGYTEEFREFRNSNKALKWFLIGFERKENKTIASLIGGIYSESNNKIEARKWYGIAGRLGDIASQGLYGKYLINGWGGDKNIQEGMSWMKKAADSNQKAASRVQLELGLALLSGNFGVPQDIEQGQKYLIRSADSGNTNAEVMLAQAMLLGKYGFEIDKINARKYMKKAADKGDKDAVKYMRNYF